jgi:hypothetical protein
LTFDLDLFSRSKATEHIPVGFMSLQQTVYEFLIFKISRAITLSRIIEHGTQKCWIIS